MFCVFCFCFCFVCLFVFCLGFCLFVCLFVLFFVFLFCFKSGVNDNYLRNLIWKLFLHITFNLHSCYTEICALNILSSTGLPHRNYHSLYIHHYFDMQDSLHFCLKTGTLELDLDSNMWHDQGEWVTCRQYSIFIFQYKSLVHLKCYILIQTPSQSDIWLRRYEYSFKLKNNVKYKNLLPF